MGQLREQVEGRVAHHLRMRLKKLRQLGIAAGHILLVRQQRRVARHHRRQRGAQAQQFDELVLGGSGIGIAGSRGNCRCAARFCVRHHGLLRLHLRTAGKDRQQQYGRANHPGDHSALPLHNTLSLPDGRSGSICTTNRGRIRLTIIFNARWPNGTMAGRQRHRRGWALTGWSARSADWRRMSTQPKEWDRTTAD